MFTVIEPGTLKEERIKKPQINTNTLTPYGVECLLRLKSVQVTILRQSIPVHSRLILVYKK